MALTLKSEERAANAAMAVYLARLLEDCESVGELVEVLRGTHTHLATVAGEDGKPCAVRVTYVVTDDPADVLAAIASGARDLENVGAVPLEKKESRT